jgi:hypothetical protein
MSADVLLNHGSRRYLRAALALVTLIAPAVIHAMTPDRVLVVYRANSPDIDKDGKGDSEQAALYYAGKRGVPAQNLLGLTITVPYFSTTRVSTRSFIRRWWCPSRIS